MTKAHIFIIAGEASGDLLGADLMASLPSDFHFSGIGGSRMQNQGLTSLFPMEELSVMGIFEILPKIFMLKRRINETVEAILKEKPDLVITIDSPGFTHRVLKKIRNHNIPAIHYVAPTVWAWKPGRAKKLSKLVDHLLTLFPFEASYFEKEGLETTFVGHPIAHITTSNLKAGFRARHKIPINCQILCLLPGSRLGEITRMLPIFVQTLRLLEKSNRSLHIIIPTFERFVSTIETALFSIDIPYTIITKEEEKRCGIAASTVALATSGTIALELSAFQVPCIIAYKMSGLTYALIKRMIKVKYASLPNLLLNEAAIPEFIQNDCTATALTTALNKLLDEKEYRQTMKDKMLKAMQMLHAPLPFESTGECAANVILEHLKKGEKNGR